MNGGAAFSYAPAWGSPLELGNGICAPTSSSNAYQYCSWFFHVHQYAQTSVKDTTASYASGPLTDLSNFPNLPELATLPKDGFVARSLDVQPTNGGFAIACISSPSVSGFSPSIQHMQASELQSFATSEGLQGRVVTALSLDSPTTAYVLSYGWANDPHSVYEASVAPITTDTVASIAQNLAAQGYVLTAFGAGGNPTFGWYLVGTRLQGSTTPRPVFVSSPNIPSEAQYYAQGYVDVVTIFDVPSVGTSTVIWIVEK
jgi:hypothetical protein